MKILIAFIVFIFSAQCSSNNIQPFEAHEKCLSNNTLCNRRNASSVNSIPANTNMVNYSIQTGTTSYEVFDSSTFHNRSLSQETTDPLSHRVITYADNLHLGKVPGLDEESNILPI